MLKKMGKVIAWLAIHIFYFVLLVWFFLGMSPKETYYKSMEQLSGYMNGSRSMFHNFFDASKRLGAKANKYGLQEAKDVMAGKDYYEGYDMKIDQRTREQDQSIDYQR